MKRPVAIYMLLIALLIFVFFLLNILLGSIQIPFKDVWHILWGDYNGNEIWQNIVWKSRIPQAHRQLIHIMECTRITQVGKNTLQGREPCPIFPVFCPALPSC